MHRNYTRTHRFHPMFAPWKNKKKHHIYHINLTFESNFFKNYIAFHSSRNIRPSCGHYFLCLVIENSLVQTTQKFINFALETLVCLLSCRMQFLLFFPSNQTIKKDYTLLTLDVMLKVNLLQWNSVARWHYIRTSDGFKLKTNRNLTLDFSTNLFAWDNINT